MKASTSLLLALAASVEAHVAFTNFFINGKDQGSGVAVRMRKDPATATFPLIDLNSPDMACNVNGDTGVGRTAVMSAGDQFTSNWRAWPDGSKAGTIDISHKGPCAVYMKKMDDPDGQGSGDGWFKIWQDGYDEKAKKWCTEKLIDNNGMLSVNIPTDIAQGYYLIRPELLALHAAASQHQPQYYTGCAQTFIKSSGSATPPTVSIPGYTKPGSKANSINIWAGPMDLPYPIPGPAPYTSGSGGKKAKRSTIRKRDGMPSSIKGLKPASCICENGNWCGTEPPSSNDQSSCWATSAACWKIGKACYDAAGPAGNDGCAAYDDKCQKISDACNAGNYKQPANAGTDITPKSEFMSGASMPAPYVGVGQAEGGGPDRTGEASPVKGGGDSGSSSSGGYQASMAPGQASSVYESLSQYIMPTSTDSAAATQTAPYGNSSVTATGDMGAATPEPTTSSTTTVLETVTRTTSPGAASTPTETGEAGCDDSEGVDEGKKGEDQGEKDCDEEDQKEGDDDCEEGDKTGEDSSSGSEGGEKAGETPVVGSKGGEKGGETPASGNTPPSEGIKPASGSTGSQGSASSGSQGTGSTGSTGSDAGAQGGDSKPAAGGSGNYPTTTTTSTISAHAAGVTQPPESQCSPTVMYVTKTVTEYSAGASPK